MVVQVFHYEAVLIHLTFKWNVHLQRVHVLYDLLLTCIVSRPMRGNVFFVSIIYILTDVCVCLHTGTAATRVWCFDMSEFSI
jgi:hypothetical protein